MFKKVLRRVQVKSVIFAPNSISPHSCAKNHKPHRRPFGVGIEGVRGNARKGRCARKQLKSLSTTNTFSWSHVVDSSPEFGLRKDIFDNVTVYIRQTIIAALKAVG